MDEVTPDSSGTLRLLELAASGSNEAFEELFGRHRVQLRQFIELRMDKNLRQRVDASDVLQETQLEVHRRIADYSQRRPMPLRIWLRKTARERLLNLREKHVGAGRRDVTRELPLPERSSMAMAQQLVDRGPSPSEQHVQREKKKAIARAIAELSESDREVLLMRNIEGLDYIEIGYALEIAPATARKRYGRALLRLEPLLRSAGLGESSP